MGSPRPLHRRTLHRSTESREVQVNYLEAVPLSDDPRIGYVFGESRNVIVRGLIVQDREDTAESLPDPVGIGHL